MEYTPGPPGPETPDPGGDGAFTPPVENSQPNGPATGAEIPPKPTVQYRDGWSDAIPDEMRGLRRWVIWSFDWRTPKKGGEGKWTKEPFNPDSPVLHARTNDPRTWDTFDAAIRAWEREPGKIDGIGFVFAKDDPFCGVDFDNCLNADGELADWARPYVEAMEGSYGEVSPSGTGIKFFVRARLPEGETRKDGTKKGSGTKKGGFGPDGKGAIEIYDQVRFFTTTGNIWGEARTLEDRQDAVSALYAKLKEPAKNAPRKRAAKPAEPSTNGSGPLTDDELIRKAREARNGAKFAALFDAGSIDGHPSESEADLALCNMLAFWTGCNADQMERLWMASALGAREKTQERADYRAETIAKAIDGCDKVYEKSPARGRRPTAEGRAETEGEESPGPEGQDEDQPKFTNFAWEPDGDDESGEPKFKKVAIGLPALQARLARLDPAWPKRVGQDHSLFVETIRHSPIYLDSPQKLFAWIGGIAKTEWAKGVAFEPQERFYEYLRMHVDEYEAIEMVPHFPPIPDIYYMHSPIGVGNGRVIEAFIDLFCPHTSMDRELIRAMLLTLFWGGRPGARPAFLITGPDGDRGRGIGKSTFADIIASVSQVKSVDVSPTDQITDVKTRLLSAAGRHARVARLDNVKALRLSWADLEGLITARDISGRMLFKGEGSRPNTVMWCITLNGASLSTDMAQRCIILKLSRPVHRPEWEDEVKDFIETNRAALIADVRAALETPTEPIKTRTRWALWEREILGRCRMANLIQDVIIERQSEVDDDDEDAMMVADHFRSVMREGFDRRINPDADQVLISSPVAAKWYCEVMKKGNLATNQASAALKNLAIPELRKSDRGKFRGWIWRNPDAKSDPKHLRKHSLVMSNDQPVIAESGDDGDGGVTVEVTVPEERKSHNGHDLRSEVTVVTVDCPQMGGDISQSSCGGSSEGGNAGANGACKGYLKGEPPSPPSPVDLKPLPSNGMCQNTPTVTTVTKTGQIAPIGANGSAPARRRGAV